MLAVTIKEAFSQAFREKNFAKKNLLGLIKGDILLLEKETGKEAEDAQVVKLLKKYLKGIEESLAIKADDKLVSEKQILEAFLPTLLSKQEIETILDSLEDLSLRNVMTYFATHYSGRVDNKLVSELVRRRNS